MPRAVARAAAGLAAASVVAASLPARADPQGSLGLTAAGAVEHDEGGAGVQGALQLGARGDVLQRASPRAVGAGAYLDLAASTLGHGDAGGGAELLLPVTEDLPLVAGAGAFARDLWGSGRWSAGAAGSLFFGSRSFNYHGAYGLAAGLFAEARWVPGPEGSLEAVAGLQIDAELVVLPALLLWGAVTR